MAELEPVDLVLQGGGVKGVALAGAVTVMLQRYRVARVAGTSAGAILAALIAAGYDAAGVRAAMLDLNYRKVPDPARLPFVGTSLDLLMSNGLHSGAFILEWIGNKLADRNVYVFDDLRLDDDPGADPELAKDKGFRLVVTATDVTRGRALRLPWDYRAAFGVEPGQQSVAEAVRMSMSIPLFFRPCTKKDEGSGDVCTIVDGGVLTNFPLEIFDRRDGRCPRWPTLGIGVIPDLPGKDSTVVPAYLTLTPLLRLLSSVLITAVLGHDQTYLAQPENRDRLTRIDTEGVGIVEFGIDDARRDDLFRRGERAAQGFLDTWDWDAFRARYLPQCAAAV